MESIVVKIVIFLYIASLLLNIIFWTVKRGYASYLGVPLYKLAPNPYTIFLGPIGTWKIIKCGDKDQQVQDAIKKKN